MSKFVFLALLLLAGCASQYGNPYPNDRSMASMSAEQLEWELHE